MFFRAGIMNFHELENNFITKNIHTAICCTLSSKESFKFKLRKLGYNNVNALTS